MTSPTDFKGLLVERLFSDFNGQPTRVLDLGCGTANNFVGPLRRHPNVRYTGIEQDEDSLRQARAAIGKMPNADLRSGFGEDFDGAGFDVVMSLSVLEHVKHLDDFLETSVQATRPGGQIIHRYDLGHALYPATKGERLRVATARRLPAIVPAARFTTYPDLDGIVAKLGALGVDEIAVTRSQMPSLKAAVKLLVEQDPELCRQVVEMDEALAERLAPRLEGRACDRLFPAITVMGRRR